MVVRQEHSDRIVVTNGREESIEFRAGGDRNNDWMPIGLGEAGMMLRESPSPVACR